MKDKIIYVVSLAAVMFTRHNWDRNQWKISLQSLVTKGRLPQIKQEYKAILDSLKFLPVIKEEKNNEKKYKSSQNLECIHQRA